MSFVTALGLSARNLMTKKGRTAMTAFAGSIGIIGIAAILALSNGVNGYIKKVEEDTLSSYPLTISKQDYDLSSMMDGQGLRMMTRLKTWIRPTTVPAARLREPIRFLWSRP